MPAWAEGDPLSALTGAVEDLAGQFALQPLLDRILRRSVGLLRAGAGSICTVDERAGTYLKVADLGVACQHGSVFPLAEGTVGAVARARGPVVFDRYTDVPGGHVAAEERDRLFATLGVPIEWDGEIIGACVVFSTDPARRWKPADVDLLRLFAGHAAVAIANARLHAAAADRLRRLAVDADRERVVRDVHDALVRTLGGVLTHLDALGDHGLHEVREAVVEALTRTRRTVFGLGPALLDGRSLPDAVRAELAWVRATTSLNTDLVVTGEPTSVDDGIAAPVLHAVQEALTNVVSHAQATQVRIGIMCGRDRLTALVADDGRGFDAGRTAHPGLDRTLTSIEQLGGTVDIEATPGWGTRVRLEVPTRPSPPLGSRRVPLRVLVADGRPLVRAGLTRLLTSAEPDVVVVGEASDAPSLARRLAGLEPDIVVTGPDGAPGPAPRVVRAPLDIGAAELAELVVSPSRTVVRGLVSDLTSREREVGALVGQGLADKQIAARLGISVKTVEKHVGAVLRKTGSANRTILAGRWARRAG